MLQSSSPQALLLQQQAGRHIQSSSTQSLNSQLSHPDIHPFFKVFNCINFLFILVLTVILVVLQDPSGRYIVLYTFIARDENDVSVERGEFVTVLNREDPDWYWVVRSDGQEGFVPSAFVYPAEAIQSNIFTFVILFLFICECSLLIPVLPIIVTILPIIVTTYCLYLWWYGFYR